MNQLHKLGACTCCADLLADRFAPLAAPNRRHVLRAVGGIGLFSVMAPFTALAASGDYEAMVLGCIDPRLQEPMA